jgi:hypothetical protein
LRLLPHKRLNCPNDAFLQNPHISCHFSYSNRIFPFEKA